MSNEIMLSDFMTALHPLDMYKMHFAKRVSNGKNDSSEPLDAYLRSFDEWKDWNRWSKAG